MAVIKFNDLPEVVKKPNESLSKDELIAKVHALTPLYNECVQSGDKNPAMENNNSGTTVLIDTVMKECINEYTGRVKNEVLRRLASEENPMMQAVIELDFDSIRVKDSDVGEGESKISVRTIEPCKKPIDLPKLHSMVSGGIGVDKGWQKTVGAVCHLLTVQNAVDLGLDPQEVDNSSAVSDIARSIELGKNPCSKTNMLKTLRKVISDMIGEGFANQVTSHDVNFLLKTFTRKGREALSVVVVRPRQMVRIAQEICHKIVLEKAYKLVYKQKN